MESQARNGATRLPFAKVPPRTQTASTKLTAAEFSELESVAAGEGVSPGEWIREVLLREIRRATGHDPTEVLLTEIIGLQMFLTNALAPLVQGDRISSEQYQDLMSHVKANKRKAAQQVLAQRREARCCGCEAKIM
jgi:hypothetical protein